MPQQQAEIIANATRSETENVPETQSLTTRVQDLSRGVDLWNSAMMWALVFAAIAAIAVVLTTRMVLRRSKQLSTVQDQLSQAKDDENRLQTANLLKTIEDERLARAEIEEALAWRRLSPADEAALRHQLIAFPEEPSSLWFNAGDAEGTSFAWELAKVAHDSKWRVFRPASILDLAGSGLPFVASEAADLLTSGVLVSTAADSRSRKAGHTLVAILNKRGFDATLSSKIETKSPSGVWVTVETRPRGPQGEAKVRAEAHHK